MPDLINLVTFLRGKHRHHKTVQAVICLEGAYVIWNHNNVIEQEFLLDSPEKCLLLYPEDFHEMYNFSPNAILMILASEKFDPNDYIFQPYS